MLFHRLAQIRSFHSFGKIRNGKFFRRIFQKTGVSFIFHIFSMNFPTVSDQSHSCFNQQNQGLLSFPQFPPIRLLLRPYIYPYFFFSFLSSERQCRTGERSTRFKIFEKENLLVKVFEGVWGKLFKKFPHEKQKIFFRSIDL